MELQIVNPDPKYRKVELTEPTNYGYIYMAATVRPGRLPLVPPSAKRARLLRRAKRLARDLGRVDGVIRVTVFRAIAMPPTARLSPYLRERKSSIHPPKFDVLVLVETTSPETAREIQKTAAYTALMNVMKENADATHVLLAKNAKRVGNVDETKQGLFLFNHFVADDVGVGLELWEYLANWFTEETGLDNSVVLTPLEGEQTEYSFINEARWDLSLPRYVWNQLRKKSFRNYVLANLERNRVGAMPVFYRLA